MDIYQKFDRAFAHVEAHVIIGSKGDVVAKIAFKRGNAVTAFVHWYGLTMEFGVAQGGGYDRASAACDAAARKLKAQLKALAAESGKDYEAALLGYETDGLAAFLAALDDRDGARWSDRLYRAGFKVYQAV